MVQLQTPGIRGRSLMVALYGAEFSRAEHTTTDSQGNSHTQVVAQTRMLFTVKRKHKHVHARGTDAL